MERFLKYAVVVMILSIVGYVVISIAAAQLITNIEIINDMISIAKAVVWFGYEFLLIQCAVKIWNRW